MSPPLFEMTDFVPTTFWKHLVKIFWKIKRTKNKIKHAMQFRYRKKQCTLSKKSNKQKKPLLILKWPKNMHAPISNLNKFFLSKLYILSLWTWQTATLLSRVCDIEESTARSSGVSRHWSFSLLQQMKQEQRATNAEVPQLDWRD